MAITIYGAQLSPFVRKVRVFLAEKGADYELDPVNPFSPPDWFAGISPLRRIPVLRDDTYGKNGPAGTIPDSSAICGFLEKKFPEPALYPGDPFAHGRALWYEEYADSDLAANIGAGVFQPIVLRALMGKEPDRETPRQALDKKLPRFLDYLDGEAKGREFLVGNSLSIADISVASPFVNLDHAGLKLDTSRWPNLLAFLERMHARPSFAKCIDEERGILQPLADKLRAAG